MCILKSDWVHICMRLNGWEIWYSCFQVLLVTWNEALTAELTLQVYFKTLILYILKYCEFLCSTRSFFIIHHSRRNEIYVQISSRRTRSRGRGFPSMTRGPRLPVQQLPCLRLRILRTAHIRPSPSPPLLPHAEDDAIPRQLASSTPPKPLADSDPAAAMPFTPGPYSGVSTLALVSSLLWPPLLPEDSCPGDASRSDLTLPHLASSSCLCRWRGRRPSASASSTGASSSPSSR